MSGSETTSGIAWPDAASRLLERDAELGALDDLFGRARAGSGGLALVLGSPGIGKTSLLQAARELAAGQDLRVLTAGAGELEREFPFGVMRQLFEGPLRQATAAARDELLSGAAAPAAGLVGGAAGTVPGDGSALDHALYWLAANLAEQEPLALLVDDLHWGDASSLRALLHLARRLDDIPIALVASSRSTDAGVREQLMARLAAAADIVLEPAALTVTGASTLVRSRLHDADADFCDACRLATGGNPFLLSELTAAVTAAGLAPVATSISRVRSIGPHAVARSVLLRLDGLGPVATKIAGVLAVLGDGVPTALVARLAEVEPEAARVALDALAVAEIAVADIDARFVHAIVRAAVYDALRPAERSTLHMRAARRLAEAGASTDAVAAHLLNTDPVGNEWVVEQLRTAASSGMALSAPETMSAYLGRALAEPPPADERAGLLLFFGGARIQNGDGAAIEPLYEALAIATEPAVRMEASRQLAGAFFLDRRYDEALGVLDRGIAELRATDGPLAVQLEMSLLNTLYIDLPGLEERLERLAALPVDPTGAKPIDRLILARRAWVASLAAEPPDRALGLAHAALAGGTLVDDDAFGVSFEMAAVPLILAERYEDALAHFDAAIAQGRSRGWLGRTGCILPWRAELHRRCGRLELAEEDARVAAETVETGMLMFPLGVRARVEALVDRGELEAAAVALAEHGFETTIPSGGLFDGLWLARGRLRMLRNQLRAGLEDVLEYGRICARLGRVNPAWAPWRSLAARAHFQLGERDAALALAEEELELATRVGTPIALGVALRGLGLVLGGDDGRARLEESVETLAATPAILEHAQALYELGALLRRDGKREAAREPLRRALELADGAGAGPIADRARAELLASGARPRRVALSGIEALTPSERRVVDLAGEGLTNREIAQNLFITVKTVENHLRSSYGKLGVTGKRDLPAALARRES